MPSQTRTVLHVDDDPALTRVIAKKLEKRGFQVVQLNDPTKAIEELMRTQVRVVISDIDMPQLNGLDLLKQIKAFDGGVQVLMLTGLVTMTSVLQSLRWGAEACVFKPIADVDPLVAALDDAFRKLDRWWHALEELSHRKRSEQQVATSAH
ncbi:MAG: response regulator [Pirellulales bacterium]|nr:response regulator [Pirellulales bacterium]